MDFTHIPVLKKECIQNLNIKDGGVYVDCTAGRGGHIQAMLESGKKIFVIGIDKDVENVKYLEELFGDYSQNGSKVKIVHSDYKHLKDVLGFYDIKSCDGVLFDLGFSSIHIDDPQRGFSFSKQGPLDMRYDVTQTLKAEDVVNELSVKELMSILKDYGEEKNFKRISLEIEKYRIEKRITTTTELRNIIYKVLGQKRYGMDTDPATKTFQALRIYVNGELDSLIQGLDQAIDLLNPNGRLCAISFHSLEDRIVKQRIKAGINPCTCPRGLAQCLCSNKPYLKLVVKSFITPDKDELDSNPRSRSAKLRVAEKV